MPEEEKNVKKEAEPKDIFERGGVVDSPAKGIEKATIEAVPSVETLRSAGAGGEIWIDGKKFEGKTEVKPEERKEATSERYISSYERKLKEIQQAATPSITTASDDDAVKFDADSIRNMTDAEGRVQKLLDLALAKGVIHAISVAEHIDAYTLDRTHDRLVDELSDELRKRGMIKENQE